MAIDNLTHPHVSETREELELSKPVSPTSKALVRLPKS